MSLSNPKYKTINLPAPLVDEINYIKERFGYVSVSEFVKDAIRRRIEELRQL